MNLTVKLVLWVGFVQLLLTANVSAADFTTVSPEPLPRSSSIIVSAYSFDLVTKTVDFVELYNNGTTAMSLKDWRLLHDGASFFTLPDRYIVPGDYITISNENSVQNASLKTTFPQLTTGVLSLRAPDKFNLQSHDISMTKTGMYRRSITSAGNYGSSFVLSDGSPYDSGFYSAPPKPAVKIVEVYAYSSSCAPNDTSVLCGDYIKLYNPTDQPQSLDDIVLRTDNNSTSRTSSNSFHLAGTIAPFAYKTIYLTDQNERLSLTNSGGYIWLEDQWQLAGRYDDSLTQYSYFSTDMQGYAYARASDDTWQWTSTPQPDAANRITPPVVVVQPCPAGQYRNPETNRCRTIEEAVNALAACPEGQLRNPETNRCRAIVALATATLVPCKEGEERNPTTNRCRSIASAVAELLPCDEGYERNPATNRCRKAVGDAVLANPASAIKNDPGFAMMNPYVLAGIVGAGVAGYAVFEWRTEIGRFGGKVFGILGKK